MYRNIKKYIIRYTDVDAYDRLKLSSLLSYMEESAAASADELGFGYGELSKQNMGFIVVNYYIDLFKPIKLSDTVEVHTWPLRPKFLVFLRDFEFYCNGEKIGVATSRWCMIDVKNYKSLPASAFFKESDFDNYNSQRSTDFSLWKIPQIAGGKEIYSKTVLNSDYDHYFHVNNTKYADFLSDAFSVEEFKNKYIKKVQITYCRQCKYGEKICVIREDFDNFSLIEGQVDGETRVQMKVALGELGL